MSARIDGCETHAGDPIHLRPSEKEGCQRMHVSSSRRLVTGNIAISTSRIRRSGPGTVHLIVTLCHCGLRGQTACARAMTSSATLLPRTRISPPGPGTACAYAGASPRNACSSPSAPADLIKWRRAPAAVVSLSIKQVPGNLNMRRRRCCRALRPTRVAGNCCGIG